MATRRAQVTEYLIEQSLRVKSIFMLIGAILILVGSVSYPQDSLVGSMLIFAGAVTDGGVILIVYLEISRIRRNLGQTQRDLSSTRNVLGGEVLREDLEIERITDEASLNDRVAFLENIVGYETYLHPQRQLSLDYRTRDDSLAMRVGALEADVFGEKRRGRDLL